MAKLKFTLVMPKHTLGKYRELQERILRDRFQILTNRLPNNTYQFCVYDNSRDILIHSCYTKTTSRVPPSYLREWVDKLNIQGLTNATSNPHRTFSEMKVRFPNKLTCGMYREFRYDADRDDD